MKCDLHTHSNCSDGVLPPEKVVELAAEKGLECISLTDHDTMLGVERAALRAEQLGLKFVRGMEISTLYNGMDVHVLVYNINPNLEGFDAEMDKILNFRLRRNEALQQLIYAQGIDIDILHLKEDGTVGRGEIAREFVRRGYCSSSAEAFDKYLGEGRPCHIQTQRLTPVEAVKFARRFGGVPVLAHPKNLRMTRVEFEQFLKTLVYAGLIGIEAKYFAHNNDERNFFCKMAKKYHLIVTGGSDFHDYSHGLPMGEKSFSPNSFTAKILGI